MGESGRGLGRGLSALLDEAQNVGISAERPLAGVSEIPLDLIYANPDQPRRAFDEAELDELTASVREKGILQPILLRPRSGASVDYQIVAGERRWRAAQRAGLQAIPALVRNLGDLEMMEIALIENIQRADLGPLEEARGYAAMVERFSRTQETIAAMVGKSRSHVANALRLLRLPRAVQAHLEAGRLSPGHARTLIDHDDAEALAATIIARDLNVRQTEALVRGGGKPRLPRRSHDKTTSDADTRSLESDLSEVLGLEVEIRDRGGQGDVRIGYSSLEQLDDICRRLTRVG
ncbi:MAG TPA: ParB/RepB/Spo0J family partition protein [Caulobacteraceae bacterium]